MKFKLLFLLSSIIIPFFSVHGDYNKQAFLLKATQTAFDRIIENQETIRSLNLNIEKERAVALRLLRKHQSLIGIACVDINKLDNTPDAQVKKNFEQVLLAVCAIVTHLFKNILYKTFQGPFFIGGYQTLSFCQEVHISKLLHWSEGDFANHIDHKFVDMLNNTIQELKTTLNYLSESYA